MALGVLLFCLLGSGSVSTSVETKTVSIDPQGETRSEGPVVMSDERASVAVGAKGGMVPMPPGGGARRPLVRERKLSSPGDTSESRSISSSGMNQQSHAVSEPDLHESLAAFAQLQQPPVSLLSAKSMLADECKAQKAKKVGSLATKAAQSFLVVDGCKREAGGDPSRMVDSGQTCMSTTGLAGAVRCCSTDGSTCASRTEEGCFGKQKTYQQALEICTAAGMRLCTAAEVATQRCCGTGCMYDLLQVWTSDSCGMDIAEAKATETATHDDCEYGLLPGPDGATDIALNLCTGESVIDFTGSSVVHNNLGGSGPDSGPEHIRYSTVATVQGRPLDLLVSTTSPGYTPEFSAANGRQGGMGLISMKSGTKVDLKFQFVDAGATTPAPVESFTFAFLDFDRWLNGKGVECLKISGFDDYEVAPGTEIEMMVQKVGSFQRGNFCATRFGSHFDNPTNPMNLTAKQASRAVTFQFSSTSEFSATLSVSAQECGFGRTFMFAGAACLNDGAELTTITTTTSTMTTTTTARTTTTTTATTTTTRTTTTTTTPTTTTVTTTTTTANKVWGLCLAYGDPHMETFDGKHMTITLDGLRFWLFRSAAFNMEVQTRWPDDGLIVGYALSGGALGSHTVVVRNLLEKVGRVKNDVTVLYDGVRIIEAEGSTVTNNGIKFEHGSNVQPNYHHIRPEDERWQWFTDNWAKNSEHLYHITFPDGSELHTIGIGNRRPRLANIIKSYKQQGLGGLCGNFNGDLTDDWPSKGGGAASFDPQWFSRFDVSSPINLGFLEKSSESLAATVGVLRDPELDTVLTKCAPALRAAAEAACEDVSEMDKRQSCLFDICMTGDLEMSLDDHVVGVLESDAGDNVERRFATQTRVEGRCLDGKGQPYAALAAANVEDEAGCEALLATLETNTGIQGAQFSEASKCQILFDVDSIAERDRMVAADASGMWGAKIDGDGGHSVVGGLSQEAGWTCWRVG